MVCRLTVYGLLVWCIVAMVNAECTSSDCSQGTSTVLNCPTGTTQHNNYCFPNNICPPDMLYKNGFCERIKQIEDLQCPAPFIFKDGICLNESLIQPPTCTSNVCNSGNIVCPTDSTMVENTCVRNTPCSSETTNINGACAICPYNQKTVCQPPQITIVTVTQPHIIGILATTGKPTPIIGDPVEHVSPSNYVNKIDITNIVENHNIHNIPTNINAVNINTINLGSRAVALNINNIEKCQTNEERPVECPENELEPEPCCVIMEPRRCVPVGDTMKCFHRRYHKCGAECSDSGSDPSVLISYQTYPEKAGTPVEETTTDPSEDKETVVPENYPGPYPQSYPDSTIFYQGQTNQYPLTYQGQYNPYLMPNQGQPSPIPYPFPGGHNTGISMLYPGQQYPMPHAYPGGQNTGDSTTYSGQPYAIPEQSNGVHNTGFPMPYSGQQYPMSYPYPGGQNTGDSTPYSGQPYAIPEKSNGVHITGFPMPYPGQQYPMSYPYPEGQNTGDSTPYSGQPYAIPEQSNGVHNTGFPMPYPGQSNPVPYPYQDHSFGSSMPYPGQAEQYAYPSQYPGGL